jgi:tryptophan 7-halogenase
MIKQLVIVGGGTAGWLTAAYLARTLATAAPDGVRITLIESADSAIEGLGEGTLPSIQRTLRGIGLDESSFLRASNATFTQGVHFAGWQYPPGTVGRNDYFHPFQSAQIRPGGLDLLPYWLLGLAPGVQLDEAATVQKHVAAASRAPKRITDADFEGPLNYAYHFDAVGFAGILRDCAKQLGVRHITDTVDAVELDESGAITTLTTHEHGEITGDLFVDCSGLRAELIGRTLGVRLKSCRSTLFCDRAVVMQVPYARRDAPIASHTISTAHEAGWTWDIGLNTRRGVGYVYSSAHSEDASAERVLRNYIGPAGETLTARQFRFEPGYRETQWYKNCVAIGLAGGCFEPLEATGILFIEVAAILLAQLFPWNGELQVAARQFNHVMSLRYRRVQDFLKMHYCLTKRADTAFWSDNTAPQSVPASLQDLLERWRFRPPESLDFDPNVDSFSESSWQFVLYGMGYRTDLSAKAGTFRHSEQARKEFVDIGRESRQTRTVLPGHRELVRQVYLHGFRRPAGGTTSTSGR